MINNHTSGGRWVALSPSHQIFVSKNHGFSTDTILLAHFAAPKRHELCADFGTGCGAIPIIWRIRYAFKACTAFEKQEEALAQAKRSLAYNRFDDEISLVAGDLNHYKQLLKHHSLDLIACNPPYFSVSSGILNENRSKQDARHETAFSLNTLAQAANYALKYGGRLCICQRPDRLVDAITIFRDNKLEPKRLRFVQQTAAHAPSLFLLEAKKGGNSGMRVESVLLIEGEGGYSSEMMRIYGGYPQRTHAINAEGEQAAREERKS